MPTRLRSRLATAVVLLRLGLIFVLAGWTRAHAAKGQERVDYRQDIRPILSDKCYQCHGPDSKERQAGLRLDLKDPAFAELESGARAIIAGDGAHSALVQRITSEDPDLCMPPADAKKQLTADEIDKLQRWVAEGAVWSEHWAFQAPARPPVPSSTFASRAQNPIDGFVFARLEQAGLAPQAEASRRVLARRAYLDLTGLPPSPEEVERFVADRRPLAYERLIDRLLDSPRYGEHLARFWLDAARYGDTHGLHLDNERSLWPYRDWVINAFNSNTPFDQFTVEQLAGDLLPERQLSQRVATGFNRCNVTTSEGGAIPEEWRVRYAVDRVETTSTVFLGLTAGCAVCHDHKFDPLSQREFYQLFAYFGSVDENPMDGNALLPPPVLRVPSAEQVQQQDQLNNALAEVRRQIQEQIAGIHYVDPGAATVAQEAHEYVWIDDEPLPANANPQTSGQASWQFISAEQGPVFSGQQSHRQQVEGLGQHFFTGAKPGLRLGKGDRLFTYVYLDPMDPPRQIMLQFNDGAWEHRAYWGESLIDWGKDDSPSRRRIGDLPPLGEWVRLELETEQVGLAAGAELNGWAFTQFDGTVYWDKSGIVTRAPQGDAVFASLAQWEQLQREADKPALPAEVTAAIKADPEQRTEQQRQALLDYFLEHVYADARESFAPLHTRQTELQNQLKALQDAIPATMVMQERAEPIPTYVLARGQYDQPDKSQLVTPNTPSVLPALTDAPANRLGLARWLVDERNPLTARVTINRLWQQIFGVGLVKTAEDFGSQGEYPSHPLLLDWLAIEFIDSGWDVKHMLRLMVTSAAYRQSSQVTADAVHKDPRNRLLSRGPRFRLDAETLRDQALVFSGLLVGDIGGKSVKPYQPEGLWKAVGYSGSNTVQFKRDDGPSLFRRTLYTFLKRTAPPPGMSTFDAPSRESCSVRRERTNTPLQALLLLNDEQYFEAARFMAQRVMLQGGTTPSQRLDYAFRLAVARPPVPQELERIRSLLQRYQREFTGTPERANEILAVGAGGWDHSLPAPELAAWTMVCNLIMNLDETITKG